VRGAQSLTRSSLVDFCSSGRRGDRRLEGNAGAQADASRALGGAPERAVRGGEMGTHARSCAAGTWRSGWLGTRRRKPAGRPLRGLRPDWICGLIRPLRRCEQAARRWSPAKAGRHDFAINNSGEIIGFDDDDQGVTTTDFLRERASPGGCRRARGGRSPGPLYQLSAVAAARAGDAPGPQVASAAAGRGSASARRRTKP
jgi:hypothetical protein